MLKTIWRGLTRVADFSGRDSRPQFWTYAVFVLGLMFVANAAFILPSIAGSLQRMQQFAAEHPELATVHATSTSYSIQIEGSHPELMPDMEGIVLGVGVGVGLAVALLAAAVARRLRDRGRTALWGLLPLPFLGAAMVILPRLFAGFGAAGGPDLGLFFLGFFNNLAYLGALGVLAVILAGPSIPRADLGASGRWSRL